MRLWKWELKRYDPREPWQVARDVKWHKWAEHQERVEELFTEWDYALSRVQPCERLRGADSIARQRIWLEELGALNAD